jgi:signal transduction histidine kinase
MPRSLLHGRVLCGALLSVVLGTAPTSLLEAQSAGASIDRQLLMIDVGDPNRPAFTLYMEAFLNRLRGDSTMRTTVYREHQDLRLMRDTGAFATQAVAYWTRRYAGTPLAAIIANSPTEVALAARLRSRLGRAIPIVYHASSSMTEAEQSLLSGTPMITGVVYRSVTRPLLDDMGRLRPTLRHLLVIHQSPAELSLITSEVEAALPEVQIVPWFRPTVAALRDSVRRLTSDAAVMYFSMHRDGDGHPWIPADFLGAFQSASAQPIFGLYRNLVGRGVIGGPLLDPAKIGEAMADRTLALLGDPDLARRRLVDTMETWRPTYDWAELVRHGIDPRELPEDAEIIGRPIPVWEGHPVAFVIVTLLVLLQAASIIGLTVNRRALTQAKDRLSALTRRLQQTQEIEQARLARELHDTLAQDLLSQSLDLQLHAPTAAAPNQPTFVERLQRSVTRLEAIAHELHPSALQLLDLRLGVQQLVNDFSLRTNVDIAFHQQGMDRPMPDAIRATVFRITQEALANIRRHARATHVVLLLEAVDATVTLTIRDDGIGFDPERRSDARLGLLGMRERAAGIGGRLLIASAPDEGTTVALTLPLEAGQ